MGLCWQQILEADIVWNVYNNTRAVVPGVVINFSHFHLLLKNHWTNFNQTWHNTFLGEGDSSLFKWRALLLSKGRYITKYRKYICHLEIFFSKTTEPISTKLSTIHPLVMGIQVYSNEWPRPFPRGDNYEIAKTHWWNLKKIFYVRITVPIST